MKTFFREVFEYHHLFNQLLLNQLEANLEHLPERTFPLFCHVLNAHQIWNARILSQQSLGVRDIHSLANCGQLDEQNLRDTLLILENFALEQTVFYRDTKGNPFSNSIRDILFHVANHSTHHKGQIISDLRMSGIDPVITDYIFYKRQGDH